MKRDIVPNLGTCSEPFWPMAVQLTLNLSQPSCPSCPCLPPFTCAAKHSLPFHSSPPVHADLTLLLRIPSLRRSHGLSLLQLRSLSKYHFSWDFLNMALFHPLQPLCAGFPSPISTPPLKRQCWEKDSCPELWASVARLRMPVASCSVFVE